MNDQAAPINGKHSDIVGYEGRNVLVTGGLGFIGSTLAIRLTRLGARVVLVDSLIPEYGGNLLNVSDVADVVKINVSDVRDRYSIDHLVQRQDWLFNLAGQTSHLDSMIDPFKDLEINARSQLSILEACRRKNPDVKVVFASTRQLYGRPRYLPVDERHPTAPIDVNGINKLAGEMYHLLYNDVYGIRSCVLRLTNTYGPRMRIKDARQTFLGVWIRSILEDRPITVWGGGQLRDFTYVEDAVDALLLAGTSERSNGKVYNLGGDEVITLKQLAECLVEVNGDGRIEVEEFPPDRRAIDIGDYYASYELIRSELGWKPEIALREGLGRTLEFYRANIRRYV